MAKKDPNSKIVDPSLELEAWKTTIEVQKHFNDLAMRVRGLAITVLGAFLAAAGYGLSQTASIELFGAKASLTGVILASGFLVWIAFYVMDRMWYHRLLQASVKHGRGIEARLRDRIPSINLTTTIDVASPLGGLRAGARLSVFYLSVALVLFAGSMIALNLPHYGYLVFVAICAVVGLAEFKSRKV